MKRSFLFFFSAAVTVLLVFAPGVARAEAPSPELMTRLGAHAAQLAKIGKQLKEKSSVAMELQFDELDGDGKVKKARNAKARVQTDPNGNTVVVERYMEDGQDKTDEARKAAAKPKVKPPATDDIPTLPFAVEQHGNYRFDQVETDKADASRVRISFTPKNPSKKTVDGSAWVDAKSGVILNGAFNLSRPPTFVDWVRFTVELGAPTALGSYISKMTIEGKASLLFYKRRFRVALQFGDYKLGT